MGRGSGIAPPPARWTMAFMGCVGFVWIYALRVNLSVGLMAMVNHTAILNVSHHKEPNVESVTVCQLDDDGEKEPLLDGPFVWNENIQGLVLASYFYGYIFTQIPGGWIAERYNAKHIFGIGTLINALLTLLIPVASKISYAWLIAARVLMGLAAGVLVPTMHVLIASWAPPNERSKIASVIYAGSTLGTLICMPLSGMLAATLGWESIFYVQGALTIVWFILWHFLIYESPEAHPRISFEEKTMIIKSIAELGGAKDAGKKLAVPWRKVWSSMAVWAIIVGHTCMNWGWYMLLVKLPTYMRYILHFDIKANAWLSAVPYLCMWIFTILLATTLDALRSRSIIRTVTARKISVGIASLPPAICLVLVTYVGCNTPLAVVLLTLATTFVGGMFPGHLANHIDIAPPFAGTLMGITNTFATIPGILVPSFIGYITTGNQTVEAWRTIFLVTLAILGVEFIFFLIFAKGEQQSWAKSPPTARSETELEEAKRLNKE